MSSPFPYKTYTYSAGLCPIDLDVAYNPSSLNNSGKNKTLVFFHGGGLFSGSRRSRFPPLPVKLLMQRGWMVIVPDYRLLPEASIAEIIEDVKHVEQWLVQHGESLGIDLEAVAVGGSSAGSFISILALSHWSTIRSRAFLSLWSMVNTTDRWYHTAKSDASKFGGMPASGLQEKNFGHLLKSGNPKVSDDRGEMTDPSSRTSLFLWLLKEGKIGAMINASLKAAIGTGNLLDLVSNSFPPTVIVHGTADSIAPITDSEALVNFLNNAGIEARLFAVQGADHGIQPQDKYQKEFDKCVELMETYIS